MNTICILPLDVNLLAKKDSGAIDVNLNMPPASQYAASVTPPVHISVLLPSVLSLADIRPGQVIVDCTLGLGGYARAFAEAVGEEGRVIALEADPINAEAGRTALASLKNITIAEGNFRNVGRIVHDLGYVSAHSVVFDLGLSSPHVDNPVRGFSYRYDGPLDMRFSPRGQTITAAQILREATEQVLATMLKMYGEEQRAKTIASAIVAERQEKPFSTTNDLLACIAGRVPSRDFHQTVKRVFQALRIAVNDELTCLQEGLAGGWTLLRPGGKLIVVSYHSLEDRIVKVFFRSLTQRCICPRDLPLCRCDHPLAKNLTPRVVTSSGTELQTNPRSRSARLRAIQKL